MPQLTPERGAENLLLNCAAALPGERLLIAYEPSEYGYFDDDSVDCVARTARALGLSVDTLDVGFDPDHPHLSPDLLARFQAADIILFLARLGDQLRFSDMPQGKRIVVSFALSTDLLGSGFGTAHHDAFLQVKSQINGVLAAAHRVRITCPAGTDVTGRPLMDLSPGGDTSILRFPMSVFTPVPAHSFSGRVAMGFLTGTGSHYYDDYNLEFDRPVHALMRDGRLTGFDGAPRDVARANAQYDRVSRALNIDRNLVHSWHAGIHPGCGYHWDIHDNFERWGGAAFGNPRILHFHTCGAYAPGEISWNVIDPTIEIDGVTYWENGVFHADRLPKGPEILDRYPCAAALFAAPDPAIGLMPPWKAALAQAKGLKEPVPGE
jgi:hypothetical protein